MEIKTKLPLVEHMSYIFRKISLDKTILIACQHINKTNFIMFNQLFNKGLEPNNTYLLGKCYSTDENSLQSFVSSGVRVHKGSTYFDSHQEFDESYSKIVKDFFNKIYNSKNLRKYKRVILLDDGGTLIFHANSIVKKDKRIVAIEQTSSGYEKIKNLALKFPVINVARSKIKLIHESPIIAELFLANLNYEIKTLGFNPHKILIIGKGYIGRAISKELGNRYSVKFYDENPANSDFGNLEDLREGISKFDLIIGCTGKNSLPLDFYERLKNGAVLISASSSDREFSINYLRKLARRYFDCHANFHIRDLTVLNSGFPLTFTNQGIGAEPEKIQLTRAIIFSAICLTIRNPYKTGVVPLCESVQRIILEKYQELIIEKFNKLRKIVEPQRNVKTKKI